MTTQTLVPGSDADRCEQAIYAYLHEKERRSGALPPLAAYLLWDVNVEAARKCQHEGHDVRADVVVIDAAGIGNDDVACDQRVVVVASAWPRLRACDPPEIGAPPEQLGPDVAKGRVDLADAIAVLQPHLGLQAMVK